MNLRDVKKEESPITSLKTAESSVRVNFKAVVPPISQQAHITRHRVDNFTANPPDTDAETVDESSANVDCYLVD